MSRYSSQQEPEENTDIVGTEETTEDAPTLITKALIGTIQLIRTLFHLSLVQIVALSQRALPTRSPLWKNMALGKVSSSQLGVF